MPCSTLLLAFASFLLLPGRISVAFLLFFNSKVNILIFFFKFCLVILGYGVEVVV